VQAGGLIAVIAIQGALAMRDKTGEGAFIDTTLTEAATWLQSCMINPLSDELYRMTPTPDRRLYACSDGRFVAVASAEPRTWKALCEGLGLGHLEGALHDPARAEECEAAIALSFSRRTAREAVDLLASAGAAVAPVNTAGEFVNDPHAIARGSYASYDGVTIPANPVRISTLEDGKPITLLQPAVTVGQHTQEILAAAGLSQSEIDQLEAHAVI
jgi:crotonobetainyl-CoA:carnitine CoA-transferase CaiB-like acyl-CoA transferase